MGDFDEVLERLLADPSFAAALSADPVRALAGYQLDADELALLHLQVGGGTGGQHGVEARANQSSMFGLLTPLAGMVGGLSGLHETGTSGLGRALPAEGMGPAAPPTPGLGAAPPAPGCGVPVGQAGGPGYAGEPGAAGRLGAVQGMGAGAGAVSGFGVAPDPATGPGPGDGRGPAGGLAGLGDEIGQSIRSATDAAIAGADGGLGAALAGADAGFGSAGPTPGAEPVPPDVEPVRPAPPEGYRTRVDVDGDGDWDRHTTHGRADGGVDILVDLDRDGRTDFVGHDLDADGLVDVSEYDSDRDGYFEKRMYDDDGDGWMDRTVRTRPPDGPVR